MLCDKDNYLLQLIRYIHNNPVNANLKDGIEYKWSSHLYYIGKKSNIVDTAYILSIFSENKNKTIKQYLQFMNQEDTQIIYVNTDEFYFPNVAVKNKKEERKNINIDELLEAVCINENVTIENLIKKNKGAKDIRYAQSYYPPK